MPRRTPELLGQVVSQQSVKGLYALEKRARVRLVENVLSKVPSLFLASFLNLGRVIVI